MLGLFTGDSEKAGEGLEIMKRINAKCEAGDDAAVELMGPTYCMVGTLAEGNYEIGSSKEVDEALARVADARENIKNLRKTEGDISPEISEKEEQYREEFRTAVEEANKKLKQAEKKVPTKLNNLVSDVLDE